jgi:P-type E1-E2 ATPase
LTQEANVGVGLYGEEGMQAVQTADFALANFKYLWKLVLVHGLWHHTRVTKFINFFFYKNIIFTLPQFAFGFLSFFSGLPLYDGK